MGKTDADIDPDINNEVIGPALYLSPLSVWALTLGCAVGWGAFVMPRTTFLHKAGPTGIALDLQIKTFGYDHGFLSSWVLILVYMAIMWANAFSEDIKKTHDAGMNGHIADPIDVNILTNVLREILMQRT